MKTTDVARNALTACFVISADSTRIHWMGRPSGASSSVMRARASAVRTPTTMRSALRNTSMALPSRRFSGEHANSTRRPAATAANAASRRAVVPTGTCEEMSIDGPVREVREKGLGVPHDALDVGLVVLVHRRVEGDPDQIGGGDAREVRRELKPPGGEARAHELGQARLEDGRAPVAQAGDDGLVGIETDGGEVLRHASRRHGAEVPEPVDADVHTQRALIAHLGLGG